MDNKKVNVLKGKYFAKNNFPDPIKATIQIVKDILQDIPEELRIKSFDFEFKPERVELVKRYVAKAREYLNSLTLNGK